MKKSLFNLTVETRETVLAYRAGRLVRAFGPGRYRVRPGLSTVVVDMGEQVLALKPQDVPCADEIPVRVTLALRWHVVDPVAWHEVATDPLDLVYLAAQVGLRDLLAAHRAEEVTRALRATSESVGVLAAAVAPVAARVGVTVDEVVLKDITLPAELRHAIGQVVIARHQGLAKLEAARAETAALRSMANGAKLLEDHPALARLRMVEAATFGSKLVIRDA
ncbi:MULTISPECIES: SPFH domain-containing protein [unclassified Luteococcus]|uniref:SPFH domain-containing protein n=1 Tax=unclassified Luteococcus TaxID=2639923 RepID=UPI00313DA8DB